MTEAIRKSSSRLSSVVSDLRLSESLSSRHPYTLQHLQEHHITIQQARTMHSRTLERHGLTKQDIQMIDDAYFAAALVTRAAGMVEFNLTREHGVPGDNDID